MSVKDAVRWFQSQLGFINRLPSWLNELLSGFFAVGVASFILLVVSAVVDAFFGVWIFATLWPFVFPLAFVLSEFYEHTMDPWGFNSLDVVERSRGIVLAMVLGMLI